MTEREGDVAWACACQVLVVQNAMETAQSAQSCLPSRELIRFELQGDGRKIHRK